MVEVRYSGRLGNHLFQYTIGRILAEKLGYTLKANPIDAFPRTSEMIPGKVYVEPTERYTKHALSMESILLDPKPRHLLLEGFFQNHRYFAPHATRIREFLAWETPDAPATVPLFDDGDHSEDLLLHVRLGDLAKMNQAVSIDYYVAMLARVPHRRAYLAAEDVSDPLLAPLLAAGIIPLPAELGAGGTMRAADQFGALVISQATFGWWMAFLGTRIREVHVGIPEHRRIGSASLYRIADGLDLRLDDPRYSYYYRVPLIGQPHRGEITKLGNFCNAHAHSKAYVWG